MIFEKWLELKYKDGEYIESYDEWLVELDPNAWIDYADEYASLEYDRAINKARDIVNGVDK